MRPGPVFPEWNFHVLQELFRLIPHSGSRDTVAQFFTADALVSTWMYAAVFYVYWRIDDERTKWRRSRLLEIFIAVSLAVLATLAFRPWIGWPAPSLVPEFRVLYPDYFWSEGSPNCFPSHSTLIYLIVAVGFWPFKRWLSALLMLLVLLLISLPRVYVGGHYPVDVIAAILLAAVALWVTRRICTQPRVSALLGKLTSGNIVVEAFLFLCLFELAEGFRSGFYILTSLARAARYLQH